MLDGTIWLRNASGDAIHGYTESATALVIAECPPQCLGLTCTTNTYDIGSIGIDQGTGVIALFYSKGI